MVTSVGQSRSNVSQNIVKLLSAAEFTSSLNVDIKSKCFLEFFSADFAEKSNVGFALKFCLRLLSEPKSRCAGTYTQVWAIWSLIGQFSSCIL